MYLTNDHKDIIEIFNKKKVEYLLAGSFAMSKLGYSRATYDIDLWVGASKENAIKLCDALEEFGAPFQITLDDFLKPNNVIQLGVAPSRIDILTDIDGVKFEDAWKNKHKVDLDGVKCYSLSLEDLILNKAATQRPKDMLDLVQLKNLLEAKNSSLNLNKEININSQKEALSESAAEYKAACGLSQEEIRDKIYNTKDVDVGLSHK